ncbi:hypothetical protein PILCRDRAFT_828632 [Piloderma croceum F 1598]|uniref:Uncharacterized protein n=1 Tax=Piloderma croceum (strain F 1598) TaxID=765440 RepID=A0A0C3B9H9_PILCF|nr:hypothetical protein PILCRDRAFT_828632 [Piloderma croceum F 1598]
MIVSLELFCDGGGFRLTDIDGTLCDKSSIPVPIVESESRAAPPMNLWEVAEKVCITGI